MLGLLKWGVDHALDNRAAGNARSCGHTDGDFGTGRTGIDTGRRQSALRQGINFTVYTAHGGHDQVAAAQIGGFADGGNVHVYALTRFGKTGQIGCHHDGSGIFDINAAG